MLRLTATLFTPLATLVLAGLGHAQTTTMEVEPNGDKTEASVVTGMVAGDCIMGESTGSTIGTGNSASDTADYWSLETAPLATEGWYRWSLSITAGNSMTIRALDVSGAPGAGSTAIAASDDTAQNDQLGEIHWYSNETPSRLYVRVTGTGASPASYSACLSCTPVIPSTVLGSFTPGSIQITTVGQTIFDTDLSVADSSRTIIPGYLNDDDGLFMPGLQSELTRTYAAGTYYVVISDSNQSNSEGAAVDEDFVNGEVMDFPNVFVNDKVSTGDNLTFMMDDGQGNQVVTAASKGLVHGIEFFQFSVGAAFPSFCNGDGGDQMGCTDCPCANNSPPGTIGGCINSAGASTVIQGTGSTSVALPQNDVTDLRFTLSGAPSNAFCVMLSGGAVAPTGMANPCFGTGAGILSVDRDGLRCAVSGGQGVLRHGGRSADASGVVNASTGPNRVWGGEAQPIDGISGQAGFVSGQTRYFQVTHREDAMEVCMRGLNSSQALEVTFTP